MNAKDISDWVRGFVPTHLTAVMEDASIPGCPRHRVVVLRYGPADQPLEQLEGAVTFDVQNPLVRILGLN